MDHQYDFDDQLISERVPVIHVPNFNPLITSRRKLNQLNNQTLKNIQLYLQESKNREIQRIKQLKAKQQFIGQKVARHQMQKQQKIKQIQAIQKQKALKQCTFKPSINNKGSRRNLNEFLQNQNEHLKKVQVKKRNLKMTIQNQKQKQTYRPKINYKSKKSRRNQGPIYQRLYALKDKQNIPENIQQIQIQNTFKPVISQKSKKLSRNAPIEDLLYGDALRRQQKSKDILLTQNSQDNKIQKHHVNLNNQKFAAQKFIRQYFSVLQDLGINLSLHYKIDYIMYNEVLKSMGFIKQDEQSQDGISVNQRGLVYESYSMIQKFGINARNICVFLLGLIGIYHINPINFQQGQQSIPQKQFNLDQTQGRKMQKHFDILFRNRLNCQKYKKTQKQQIECSFQPKINKKSQGLAEKFRGQMLEEANQLLENYPQIQYSIPQDGIISHTDLLVLHKMAKQIQRKKVKQQKENKYMQQCTFKPTTLSSMHQTLKNSKASNFDSKLGEKKSFELYNYYKSLQNKKQSLRMSRQVVDNECTFAPNLKKQKVATSTPYAKQIDETLYRMHKGRQQKQQKQKILSRGQTTFNMGGSRQLNNESFRNSSRMVQRQRNLYQQKSIEQQQNEEDVPTLILDVNLGDKTDRISLYQKDQNRLQQVAHEFALKHDLDEQSQWKLLQLLQIQLNNLLQKIQEGEQEEHEN